jgi:hypothetical protein
MKRVVWLNRGYSEVLYGDELEEPARARKRSKSKLLKQRDALPKLLSEGWVIEDLQPSGAESAYVTLSRPPQSDIVFVEAASLVEVAAGRVEATLRQALVNQPAQVRLALSTDYGLKVVLAALHRLRGEDCKRVEVELVDRWRRDGLGTMPDEDQLKNAEAQLRDAGARQASQSESTETASINHLPKSCDIMILEVAKWKGLLGGPKTTPSSDYVTARALVAETFVRIVLAREVELTREVEEALYDPWDPRAVPLQVVRNGLWIIARADENESSRAVTQPSSDG